MSHLINSLPRTIFWLGQQRTFSEHLRVVKSQVVKQAIGFFKKINHFYHQESQMAHSGLSSFSIKSTIGIHSEIIIFLFFLKNFFIVIQLVVCIFSPSLHPTPVNPTSLPHLYPPPWFCPCVLYSSSCKPLSPLSPPHSPLAIVTLFLISMSLVVFCLLFSFVDYVPVKGEIIWYLSLTTWLISLSIMLSSSIHAVAKGISSFFLSAA